MLASQRFFFAGAALGLSVALGGCGYSQEEWDQVQRDAEALRNQLAAQRQAREVCAQEAADTRARIAELRETLAERGVDLEHAGADLAKQQRALAEYELRAKQLTALKQHAELLREALRPLAERGVAVTVVDAQLAITIKLSALFDAKKETLSAAGSELLARVAEPLRTDPELSQRAFRVVTHGDGKPAAGRDDYQMATQRARAIAAYLVDGKGGGLTPRLIDVGAGSTLGVEPAQAARAERVELVLVPTEEEMLSVGAVVR